MNRSLEKGKTYERLIVSWLQSHGILARRLKAGEFYDNGDITYPDSPWRIDAKNRNPIRVTAWWNELEQECENSTDRPMLIIKRPNRGSVGESLVVVRTADVRTLFAYRDWCIEHHPAAGRIPLIGWWTQVEVEARTKGQAPALTFDGRACIRLADALPLFAQRLRLEVVRDRS